MDGPKIMFFHQGNEYPALMSIFSGVIPNVPHWDKKQLVKLSSYLKNSCYCTITYNDHNYQVKKSTFEAAINAGEHTIRYTFQSASDQMLVHRQTSQGNGQCRCNNGISLEDVLSQQEKTMSWEEFRELYYPTDSQQAKYSAKKYSQDDLNIIKYYTYLFCKQFSQENRQKQGDRAISWTWKPSHNTAGQLRLNPWKIILFSQQVGDMMVSSATSDELTFLEEACELTQVEPNSESSGNLSPNQQTCNVPMMNLNTQQDFLQPLKETTISDALSISVPQLNSLVNYWLTYPLDFLSGLGQHIDDQPDQRTINKYKEFFDYVTLDMTNEMLADDVLACFFVCFPPMWLFRLWYWSIHNDATQNIHIMGKKNFFQMLLVVILLKPIDEFDTIAWLRKNEKKCGYITPQAYLKYEKQFIMCNPKLLDSLGAEHNLAFEANMHLEDDIFNKYMSSFFTKIFSVCVGVDMYKHQNYKKKVVHFQVIPNQLHPLSIETKCLTDNFSHICLSRLLSGSAEINTQIRETSDRNDPTMQYKFMSTNAFQVIKLAKDAGLLTYHTNQQPLVITANSYFAELDLAEYLLHKYNIFFIGQIKKNFNGIPFAAPKINLANREGLIAVKEVESPYPIDKNRQDDRLRHQQHRIDTLNQQQQADNDESPSVKLVFLSVFNWCGITRTFIHTVPEIHYAEHAFSPNKDPTQSTIPWRVLNKMKPIEDFYKIYSSLTDIQNRDLAKDDLDSSHIPIFRRKHINSLIGQVLDNAFYLHKFLNSGRPDQKLTHLQFKNQLATKLREHFQLTSPPNENVADEIINSFNVTLFDDIDKYYLHRPNVPVSDALLYCQYCNDNNIQSSALLWCCHPSHAGKDIRTCIAHGIKHFNEHL